MANRLPLITLQKKKVGVVFVLPFLFHRRTRIFSGYFFPRRSGAPLFAYVPRDRRWTWSDWIFNSLPPSKSETSQKFSVAIFREIPTTSHQTRFEKRWICHEHSNHSRKLQKTGTTLKEYYNFSARSDAKVGIPPGKNLATCVRTFGSLFFLSGYVEPKPATLNPENAVSPLYIDALNLPTKPNGWCSEQEIPGIPFFLLQFSFS